MSLKRLLAAGQSFASIRNEKTAFAMTRDNLLPAFSLHPRLRSSTGMPEETQLQQADLLEEPSPIATKPTIHATPAAPAVAKSEKPAMERPTQIAGAKRQKPGFWAFFRNLFGWRRVGGRNLVQSELELGKVKVVRNDLSDADLELVVHDKKGGPPKPLYKTTHRPERNPLIRVRTRLFEVTER